MASEIRRATEDEIRIAKAWVAQYECEFDESDDPLETKLEREYEHALEILIFANGGRQAQP
jgi:hypothetical protein